jgi:hypothetical protein
MYWKKRGLRDFQMNTSMSNEMYPNQDCQVTKGKVCTSKMMMRKKETYSSGNLASLHFSKDDSDSHTLCKQQNIHRAKTSVLKWVMIIIDSVTEKEKCFETVEYLICIGSEGLRIENFKNKSLNGTLVF